MMTDEATNYQYSTYTSILSITYFLICQIQKFFRVVPNLIHYWTLQTLQEFCRVCNPKAKTHSYL